WPLAPGPEHRDCQRRADCLSAAPYLVSALFAAALENSAWDIRSGDRIRGSAAACLPDTWRNRRPGSRPGVALATPQPALSRKGGQNCLEPVTGPGKSVYE